MRNRVVTIRGNAMKAHFKHLCEEKQGDQKKFWSTIKPHVNSCARMFIAVILSS